MAAIFFQKERKGKQSANMVGPDTLKNSFEYNHFVEIPLNHSEMHFISGYTAKNKISYL